MGFFDNRARLIWHPGDQHQPGNTFESVTAAAIADHSLTAVKPDQNRRAIKADFQGLGDKTVIASRKATAFLDDTHYAWGALNRHKVRRADAAHYCAAATVFHTIPVMEEFLEHIKGSGFDLMAQIHMDPDDPIGWKEATTQKIIDGMRQEGFDEHSHMIVSFDCDVLRYASAEAPLINRGLVVSNHMDIADVRKFANELRLTSVHMFEAKVDKEAIKAFAGDGLKICPYVVNTADRAKMLLTQGNGMVFLLSDYAAEIQRAVLPHAVKPGSGALVIR